MGYVYALVGIAVLAVFFLIVNICDMNRFKVRHYTVSSELLAKSSKVVFLSDLHDKSYGEGNKRLLKKIDEINPDYILCGGDMIVAKTDRKNDNAVSFVKEVAKKYKIYYAFGNHEYRADIYPEKYKDVYPNYMNGLADCGIVFLRNETVCREEDNVVIAGLEIDRSYYKKFKKHEMQASYVEKMLGERKKGAFTILLAHNPEFFKAYAEYGAELTLAGHLHGGVMRLPFIGGVASPAIKFFPGYSGGRYARYGREMIVSCGLGSHTIPFRIFNPGDLVVISLEKTVEKG